MPAEAQQVRFAQRRIYIIFLIVASDGCIFGAESYKSFVEGLF